MTSRLKEKLCADEVLKRAPLLQRIVRDFFSCQQSLKKNREFLDELAVIQRKFNSPEIEETANRLRREVAEAGRELESLEKEILALDGVLRDRERGLIYFNSERDGRRIYLVWDASHPQIVSWHELGETYSDSLPVEPPGPRAAAMDSPERE